MEIYLRQNTNLLENMTQYLMKFGQILELLVKKTNKQTTKNPTQSLNKLTLVVKCCSNFEIKTMY